MPYIQVNVSQKLSAQQKEQVKDKFGEIISLIPGKTQAVTMVDIADGRAVYLAGQPINGGFIDVRLYGAAEQSGKEELTVAIFETMEKLLGIKPENLYLNILELNSWGARGRLK